jgi:hypothetical protein
LIVNICVVDMSDVVPKSDYEGAGFLLKYKGNIILAERINVKNPNVMEFEYMGGKREKTDADAYKTARAELFEELGCPNIDTTTWRNRCTVVEVFQPFSKKWIICHVLELNDAEYEIIKQANIELQSWPDDEERHFGEWTERLAASRKAVRALYLVPEKSFYNYLSGFANFPKTDNRMNDAKEYGKHNSLDGYCMITGQIKSLPLRGFNTVLFENRFNQQPYNRNKLYAAAALTVLALSISYYYYTTQ